MRSYSKKRPPVKAHEGAAQLCRVLFPVEFLRRTLGFHLSEPHHLRAAIANAVQVISTFWIMTEYGFTAALGAVSPPEVIRKTYWADFKMI